MDETWRSVVESEEFSEQFAALIPNPEEADRFLAAAYEVLSRNPEIGSKIAGSRGIWSLPLSTIHGRQATLYYSFDPETVSLVAIVTNE